MDSVHGALTRQEKTIISYNIPHTDLSRPAAGPVNPFKPTEGSNLKRKNVLTGYAEETIISDHSFRTQHRTFQSKGYAVDPSSNNHIIGDVINAERLQGRDVVQMKPSKKASEAYRRKRQRKGDPSILEGEGAYRGPWARYHEVDQADENKATSDGEEPDGDAEEYVPPTATPALVTAYEDDFFNAETTQFHGSELYDYQGRSYMHVPQDLDINLRKEPGSERNYHPKKQIFKWKFGTKPINALRFFPNSGHLLLSASADAKIKLYSVYNERELLRSYSGHSKSVSDITFNASGTSFLSGSYDRKMVLWDTETGKAISSYNEGKIPHVIKFHPDKGSDEFLAGMSDNRILQFDTRSGKVIQVYDHHLASINSKLHPAIRIHEISLTHGSHNIRQLQHPNNDHFRRQIHPSLGLWHPRTCQANCRTTHVLPCTSRSTSLRQSCRIPVIRQSNRRLRIDRTIPTEPQEGFQRPQLRRRRHRRHLQSGWSICHDGRYRRLCLFLRLENR